MGRTEMAREKLFVSYSHSDRPWGARFLEHLAPLERRGLLDVWSDFQIEVGAEWERAIEEALGAARAAVLLVTPSFLSSPYIWAKEVPRLLAHAEQGMELLPLVARPCAWRLEPALR